MGGMQPNRYGFVPFVHALSGWGKKSSTGDPADLIVGRLRHVKDMILRKTAIVSSFDNIIYSMGQPILVFELASTAAEYPKDFEQGFEFGFGKGIKLPFGVTMNPFKAAVISTDMFQYAASIDGELEMVDPRVLSGVPVGESGRQQIDAGTSAMMEFRDLIENVQNQFATGMGIALQEIKKLWKFGLSPSDIKEEDIPDNYECIFEFKEADSVGQQMKSQQGSKLWAQGEISLQKNLTDFKGWTQDEADDDMVLRLVENFMRHPIIEEVRAREGAERLGLAKYLDMAKEQAKQVGKQQEGLNSPTDMKRLMGETETQLGTEMSDESNLRNEPRLPPL